MRGEPLFVGLDVGTSGVRAAAIDGAGRVHGKARAPWPHGADRRDPSVWWHAAEMALRELFAAVEATTVRALAVDGTSGTVLAVDRDGRPVAPAAMYDDACAAAGPVERIKGLAPAQSAAHGATSGLAKALRFQAELGPVSVVHQADWIASRLSGRIVSDANNALKTGYDPQRSCWPEWIAETGIAPGSLPEVLEPGTPIERVGADVARAFGLAEDVQVVAGTTDGCAAFLATGASEGGEGVTSLGSTLVLKVLSERPVFAPAYGIYSHKILGRWLAGGASNTGGAVLAEHFDEGRLEALSRRIDPEADSGLDYYPLARPGERFPIADAELPPRMTPRPDDDAAFLHGLLEGIAKVEALGYRRLAELGAQALTSVRTVGGGAANPAWTRLRERALGVPMVRPDSEEAAVGAARLALRGVTA